MRLRRIILISVRNERHKDKLPLFTKKLMEYILLKQEFIKKFLNCKTFDEIQHVILFANIEFERIRKDKSDNSELKHPENPAYGLDKSHIKFGDLAVYDTALYIGYHMSIIPDRVFLYQNGSGKGASLLVEMKFLKRYVGSVLNMSDFSEIITSKLKCFQIEDFLCVKKHKLEKILKDYFYK